MCLFVVFFSGFAIFFPGNFSAANFLSNYVSTLSCPVKCRKSWLTNTQPLQIACFVSIALYIVLKFTMRSPWQTYERMDFSKIDAVREERAYNEAEDVRKVRYGGGLWKIYRWVMVEEARSGYETLQKYLSAGCFNIHVYEISIVAIWLYTQSKYFHSIHMNSFYCLGLWLWDRVEDKTLIIPQIPK